MALDIKAGEAYTIRRQVFKIFGAAFHVYDPAGAVVGYCRQKAFKLREDIRIYTDETCATEFIVIKARSIIDFSSTYDVTLPDGTSLGTLRRKGLSSTFFKDSWQVFAPGGEHLADLKEDSGFMAVLRRLHEVVALFSPQRFTLARVGGAPVAAYRQHFNPFIYRLSIATFADDPDLDDLMILAAGCLIAAIEGRQSGG
ncbi:MAG: hypothetical protein IT437_11645 [Phycisphaerales bacterium]|nr:hypothetical protein [Phycisphaerales bacterium]